MTQTLILASTSPFRKALLANAGLDFLAVAARIDERMVEAPLAGSGATPEEVARILAEAKAAEVSERHPGAIVLGCDQTLSLGDRLFHKPEDMEAARRHLLALSGKTHQLNSAAVLVRDGEAVWSTVSIASLTMRTLAACFYRPLSGPRRRVGSAECRRLSDRRGGHSALRQDRRRLFYNCRPSAAARAGRVAGT